MLTRTTLSTLALLTAAQAAPAKRWPIASGQATCRTFYADVTASADNIDIASVTGGIPASQQVLVQSAIDQYMAGSNVSAEISAAPTVPVSGTYSLWFEYCEPKSGEVAGLFQTAHGLVGNAGYWNVLLDGVTDYSFAESAAAAGWATLSYDRLGVGRSAHPDGLSVVQISFEVAQAVAIAEAVRAGTFSDIGTFPKQVGVGHSYGSNLMTGVASVAPDAFDALVLTGFSNNVTQGPLGLAGFSTTIAKVAYPDRFSYGNDYVITPSVSADQMGFFHYDNYTQSALDKFTTTKGEYTLGQQYSIGATIALDRSNFTKPVLVITGDRDAPYCAANCGLTSLGANATQLDTARPLYPSVADSAFETYVVPDTGHGINFHETAYSAYQEIIGFVKRQNL